MAGGTRIKVLDEQIKKLGETTTTLTDRQDKIQSSLDL